jgi:hypothetical protein
LDGTEHHPPPASREVAVLTAGPVATVAPTLVTLAALALGPASSADAVASIPEPTATAQAALATVCVALAPVRAPALEPVGVACAAVVLVHTDLLSGTFRARLGLPGGP